MVVWNPLFWRTPMARCMALVHRNVVYRSVGTKSRLWRLISSQHLAADSIFVHMLIWSNMKCLEHICTCVTIYIFSTKSAISNSSHLGLSQETWLNTTFSVQDLWTQVSCWFPPWITGVWGPPFCNCGSLFCTWSWHWTDVLWHQGEKSHVHSGWEVLLLYCIVFKGM